MRIGMFWFDDSKLSLQDKCLKAISFYQEKYSKRPNMIWINPKDAEPCDIMGVAVVTSTSVLYHHFWVGMEDN